MKVLVISNLYPPDALGGYEMGCAQVVDALRSRGHEVLVLTTAPRTPVSNTDHVLRTLRLTDLWVEYTHFRSAPVTLRLAEAESHVINAFNVHALLAALKDFEPDVVYVWGLTGIGGLGLMGCLHHLRIPWVWHLMDDIPASICKIDNRVIPALAQQFEEQLSGHFLACSQQLINEIKRKGISLPGEVEVLSNWVAGPIPPVRSTYYQPGTKLRIVASAAHIGRTYDKGMDLVVKAAAHLRSRGIENFAIDIFGKIDDTSCSDLIKSEGVCDHVRLRGPLRQSELIAAYQDYDVFAFPARLREPCAFAPIEAGPSGCVPIMGQLGGNSEWFVHGVHCLKVPRTAQGFAQAWEAIIAGRINLEPIGRRLAALVRSDFHLEQLIPKIERKLLLAADQPREGGGTSAEAYRLALLAERLASFLIQEPYCA